ALRKEAACALLRPSAIASAKLANSTVNQSHIATSAIKPVGTSARLNKACSNISVVKMLPKYTTNITGLRHCVCGANFLNESTMAGLTNTGSNMDFILKSLVLKLDIIFPNIQQLINSSHEQLLNDRAK